MQRLLSNELRDRLPGMREQEGMGDPIVYAKFVFPATSWTWFVTEGQEEGDDVLFFGYVIGIEMEWGYFTLRELEEVNIKGLVIERDESFEPHPLSSCLSELTDGVEGNKRRSTI